MNLYANDPRYVRKSDYNRSRGRSALSTSRSRSCSPYRGDSGYVSKGANNQRSNDDRDSSDKRCITCGQVGHVVADRKCKPTYSVIRKSLLDKALSVPDAAALAASMMKTHFVDKKSITKADEYNSKLIDTH